MKGRDGVAGVRGVALVNLQNRYGVRTVPLLPFLRNLKRRLRLGKRELNICFLDDKAIRHLNSAFRGKDKATDVLSFPWNPTEGSVRPEPGAPSRHRGHGVHANFLGDVVISVETARRNATTEGHSTLNEIRRLVLHGVLHLLGYDHEVDGGEMMALELCLREQLGVAGGFGGKEKSKGKTQKSKGKAKAV